MPTDITISSLNGSSPFDVYVCDTGMTTCIYVNTINSGDIPYVFEIPSVFSTLNNFTVKVVDDNNCIVTSNLVV
jgi:hypothetical protein